MIIYFCVSSLYNNDNDELKFGLLLDHDKLDSMQFLPEVFLKFVVVSFGIMIIMDKDGQFNQRLI